MKIGIDLDGVVFNTEMLWATYAELYDCIELNRNSIVNKGEPRVQEKYNWTSDETNEYLDKYVDLKDFDIMPGAKEVIELLKKDGHELVVITARGSLSNSKAGLSIAAEKLKNEGIEFDRYYWNQKEKLEVCKKEKIDVMIDDNYHICETLSNENISSIYFHSLGRKHIKESLKLVEVSNWGEVYRYIREHSNEIK